MKIWINSCHAALEFDHAKIFQALGHEVSGLFDFWSKQRPKIAGITDIDAPSQIHEDNKTLDVALKDINYPNVIIVHQAHDFPERVESFAVKSKACKDGPAVVAVIFGQGSNEDHKRLARYAREHNNIWIVPYALKEFNTYMKLGAPMDRLRMIRFGKKREEFDCDSWTGTEPTCFVPANSIHHRGEGCNWNTVQMLMGAGLPITLAGFQTEEIGGLGELSFDEYRGWLTKAQCYLHVGTIPAPYTLTLLEAACSGTPIIALDNGCGLAQEGFQVATTDRVEKAVDLIRQIMSEEHYRQNRHEHSCYLANTAFSGDIIQRQWKQLLENIQHAGE